MLPINNNNPPCDPISSNCVIWQGPDLPCVDICTGDSISSVIAGLCSQLVILQDCCASGGGSGSIDITNINQTTLDGGPATTVDQLIQLIIDNINNSSSGSGAGIWACDDTLACTMEVPHCFKGCGEITLNNPDNILNIITELLHCHCSREDHDAVVNENLRGLTNEIIQIKKKPQGDPNPILKSACVDVKNTNQQPIANLVNKIEVDYCKTKNIIGPESVVLQAMAQQPTNPIPLSQSLDKRSGFVPAIPQNPTNIGESLDAAWRLINDLRTAVEKLQADNGNSGILLRMVDINTFYASGNTCAASATNAATSGNCLDLWNSTGNSFDTTVKAYSEPIANEAYELTANMWYAQCPGSTYRAQYLGGIGGVTVAPFWTEATENCEG